MNLNLPEKFKFFEFGSDFEVEKRFVESLYINEQYPIFEQNIFHVLSYLSFRNTIYGVSGGFGKTLVCISDENKVFLFTPVVNKHKDFIDFVDLLRISFKQDEVLIQNVSERWIEKISKFYKKHQYKILPRSIEEAVYDVDLLTKLEGKKFAGLRNSKNRLLNKGLLKFDVVSETNLGNCLEFLTKWQKYQGFKYTKNKYEKEKFVYTELLHLSQLDKNLLFQVGVVDDTTLSVVALIRSNIRTDWGIIYELKGLNRKNEGGIHGITDATYCHIFEKAKSIGLKYLNDGELGAEEGTRNHKLRFEPITFLKSFDVVF